MPFPKSAHEKSVLDTCSLTPEQLLTIFNQADSLQETKLKTGTFQISEALLATARQKVVSFLFFEPSTRTRMSFEMAAHRLGCRVQLMDSMSSSSLSKGETYSDTVLNVLAMSPDALVIRYGNSEELDLLLPSLDLPVLNAGSGVTAHPSQALLDAYTIRNHFGSVQSQRVLIVGDVRHSRVARSNFDVLLKLGAEVGVCGPAEFLPSRDQLPAGVQVFDDFATALAWCTVYMALRIQLERHQDESSVPIMPAGSGESCRSVTPSVLARRDYNSRFGLGPDRLEKLAKDAIILHPGPINHGVELSVEAIRDPRARILKQVENGVLIRAVLLSRALGFA